MSLSRRTHLHAARLPSLLSRSRAVPGSVAPHDMIWIARATVIRGASLWDGGRRIQARRGLSSQFNRQRVVIGACTEAVNQDVIEWLHVRQFAQERDHVRGR